MIDPINITKFDNTTEQLEENLLFWVLAAGKNAITSSKNLEKVLSDAHARFGIAPYKPFHVLNRIEDISSLLKLHGIGCYNNKSRTIRELLNANLDLHACSTEDLENIYGIGMKTSRCFIIHTRKNAKYAGLDVHILSFLKDQGYSVPSQTPTNKKKYLEIERIFLDIVSKTKYSVAEYDLMIWKKYRSK